MKATVLITQNKIQLQRILMNNVLFVIECVWQAKLLVDVQYLPLKYTAQANPVKAATDIVDAMIFLGEETCRSFLHLLQDTQLTDVLPGLKEMPWYSPAANTSNDPTTTNFDATQNGCSGRVINNVNSAPPNLGLGTDAPNGKETFKMSSVPRGYCLILENETFTDPELGERKGTDKDSLRLAHVYRWLGFTVILCKDKTKAQMVVVLKFFAGLQSALPNLDTPELLNLDLKQWSGKRFNDVQRLHEHGDGFVCCILSHGEEKGVCGADGQILSTREIRSAFSNIQCPALREKPKVFFVQACRGELDQTRVFQTDTRSLPELTDFLFAYGTLDPYTSIRDVDEGSWFIQTLCDKLENGCPRGDDINTILTRVNSAVCKMDCKVENVDGDEVDFKQSTVFESNLSKLLIFHPA